MPKYLALSRKIEGQIREGRWKDGDVLSARVIARENKLSMVTAARALQVLRDSGVIRTIDRIGSYVAPQATGANSNEVWSLCTRITPGSSQQARVALVQNAFRDAARREAFSLEVDAFAGIGDETATRLRDQVRRAVDQGSGGLFFLPTRHSTQAAVVDQRLTEACRSEGLPIVLIERNIRSHSREIEFDLVASDDLDGGYRCTMHLLEQGRRKIAFVNGSPTSSHRSRLAGYLLANSEIVPGGASTLVLDERSGVPSRDAYRELADQVVSHAADGVVCYQDHTALGLIVELLTRGLRVPQDVAITGFDDLPIGLAFALGVTTYPFPWPAIASEAIRVMRRRVESPSAPLLKCLIPSSLIIRESSAGTTESRLVKPLRVS